MSTLLIMHVTNPLDEHCHWVACQNRQITDNGFIHSDNIDDLANRYPGAVCHLYLASEQLSFMKVPLPNTSHSALQTIPYQIEEFLAESLEQSHIAYKHDGKNEAEVIICNRQKITHWQSIFDRTNLQLNFISADLYLLPESSSPAILIDRDRILVRSHTFKGVLPLSLLAHTLEQLNGEIPECLIHKEITHETREILKQHNITPTTFPDLLTEVTSSTNISERINLLSGDFAKQTTIDKVRGLILAPAVAAIMLLSLWLGTTLLENHQLEKEIKDTRQAAVSLYKTLYPQAKRVINPASQMRANLRQQNSRQAPVSFITQLNQLAPLINTRRITIKSIRYEEDASSLRLLLTATEFSPLEELQKEFKQQNISSQFGDLIQTPEGVSGLITLTQTGQGS